MARTTDNGDIDDGIISVDLGATWIRTAVITGEGKIVARRMVPTPVVGPSGAVVADRIADLIRDVTSSLSPASQENLAGIGVSTAGPIDPAAGVVINSPNMAFPRIDLARPLNNRFGLPVIVINDAQAGAWGEYCAGSRAGCPDMVYITVSTGIGGGVISGGRLIIGAGGNAGEIGHIHVDDRYNLPCGCGCTGHWEAYSSGRNIVRFFDAWCLEHVRGCPPIPDAVTLFGLVKSGDPVVLDFLENLADINARGVSSVIAMYDPAAIIMDGPLVRQNGREIIGPMVRKVDRYLLLPDISLSTLKGDASLIGAAFWARDTIVSSPRNAKP